MAEKAELTRTLRALSAKEAEVSQLKQRSSELERLVEDYASRVRRAEQIEETHGTTRESFTNLRKELEESLEANNKLAERLRAVSEQNSKREIDDALLHESISKLRTEIVRKNETIESLQHAQESLQGRLRAETEAADVARVRAESAVRAREILELQLDELRQSHKNDLQLNTELETTVASLRGAVSKLQGDLQLANNVGATASAASTSLGQGGTRRGLHLGSRGRPSNRDHDTNNGPSSILHVTGSELETLRDQVSSLRKELLRREMCDEAAHSQSGQGHRMGVTVSLPGVTGEIAKTMYDRIIDDLRKENARLTQSVHDAQASRDDALRRSVAYEEIQEELTLQKEVSQVVAAESANSSMAIAAASERVAKIEHEKHILTADLSRLETDLQIANTQIARLREDLHTEKANVRASHVEKLASERKASEACSERSKLEASLDQWKNAHSQAMLEMDRTQRNIQELHSTVNQLKTKLSDAERTCKEMSDKVAELSSGIIESAGREDDARSELQLVRHEKDTLTVEIDALRKGMAAQKVVFDSALSESRDLREQLDEIRRVQDFQRQDAAMLESSRVETQLGGLRRDLEKTIEDWKMAESDKRSKMTLIATLQSDLVRERETNNVLRAEVAFLSERLQSTRLSALTEAADLRVSRAATQNGHGTLNHSQRHSQTQSVSQSRASSPSRVRFDGRGAPSPSPFSQSEFRVVPPPFPSMASVKCLGGQLDASRMSLADIHDLHLAQDYGENESGKEALRRRREERARRRELEAAGPKAVIQSTPNGAANRYLKADFEKARSLLLSASRT